PPSPNSAPRRSPLALPHLLPVLANNVPTGSLAGSTPHSSVPSLQKSPPSLPGSALLVLQTTPAHSVPSHTPAPSRSILPLPAAALPHCSVPANLLLSAANPASVPKSIATASL